MKPFINRIHFRLNFRLVIGGVVFLLMIFVTLFTGGFSVWNTLPRILPSYNWLLWIVIFSFSVAFIDVIFYLTILVLLEFLIILAVAYIVSLSGIFSFNSIFIYFKNGEHGAILSAGLYIITIVSYYRLWKLMPRRMGRRYTSDFNAKGKEDYSEGTEIPAQETARHTKEELGRLINLWQMKYAQATTDEERKMANGMILKYTDELKSWHEQNGTTPERAKLEGGGDKK